MNIKRLFSGDADGIFIQFIRYAFVGGFAFIVDYGALTFLVEICKINPVVSATISFVAGLLVNYYISKKWVFKNSEIDNKIAEFIVFSAIGVVGLFINAFIIWIFSKVFATKEIFGELLPQDKYYLVGKLFSTAIVFVWNFLGRKFLIFNKK